MVVMDNLIRAHENLNEGFEIRLRFKSGAISTIKRTDKLTVIFSDIRITRFFKNEYICSVFFNCADVESFTITSEE